ncbi:putative membrane protein [Clostridium argentinense CDC 2741]|uniref:Putative membrane protein n=1 Tax=Clostridium argentinense CDC 2741 TaxID=1418104 RepID=A0A0C1U3P3_9CLOT|nr:hypothetical protein [Clostridium argentinense]ARC85855.1 hypothetical protein RSJ17_15810 [Clostridium argentinense]KIE46103.1 putative membrane protein [Clostridium argentinense CDC 2741]NFF39940.1 hypothetical protein [Clostridium argentinense]NFP48571.1 hypothetical protein [Clostridium argentinense]NFP71161.1 hypothetical protein [Clostridium argentinense]
MLKLVKYQFKSNFKNLMIFLVTTLVFQILFLLRLDSLVNAVQMSSSSFDVGVNNITGLIDMVVILGVIATSVIPLILFIQNCISYGKMMENYNLMLTPQKGVNYPLSNLIYWTICLVIIGLINLIFLTFIASTASRTMGFNQIIPLLKLLLTPMGLIFLINILIQISLFLAGILLSITVCTMKIANKSIHWGFGIIFYLVIDKIYGVIIKFTENKMTFANIIFNVDTSLLNSDIFPSIAITTGTATINLVVLIMEIIALVIAIFAAGYIIDKKLEV